MITRDTRSGCPASPPQKPFVGDVIARRRRRRRRKIRAGRRKKATSILLPSVARARPCDRSSAAQLRPIRNSSVTEAPSTLPTAPRAFQFREFFRPWRLIKSPRSCARVKGAASRGKFPGGAGDTILSDDLGNCSLNVLLLDSRFACIYLSVCVCVCE